MASLEDQAVDAWVNALPKESQQHRTGRSSSYLLGLAAAFDLWNARGETGAAAIRRDRAVVDGSEEEETDCVDPEQRMSIRALQEPVADDDPENADEANGDDGLYDFQRGAVRESYIARAVELLRERPRSSSHRAAWKDSADGQEYAELRDIMKPSDRRRARARAWHLDIATNTVSDGGSDEVAGAPDDADGATCVASLPDDPFMFAWHSLNRCDGCKCTGTAMALAVGVTEYPDGSIAVRFDADERRCVACAEQGLMKRSVRGSHVVKLPSLDALRSDLTGPCSLLVAQAQMLLVRGSSSGRAMAAIIALAGAQSLDASVRLPGLRPNPMSAGVRLIGQFSGMECAVLPPEAIDPEVMNAAGVRRLHVSGFELSSDTTALFARCGTLRDLEVNSPKGCFADGNFPDAGTEVEDEGGPALVRSLRRLSLGGHSIVNLVGSGFARFEVLTDAYLDCEAQKETLSLNDDGLVALGRCPALRRLRVRAFYDLDFSDRGFEGLAESTSLEQISISGQLATPLTSRTAFALRDGPIATRLHSLKFAVRKTNLVDHEMLCALAELPAIERLSLSAPRIASEPLITRLKEAASPVAFLRIAPRTHGMARWVVQEAATLPHIAYFSQGTPNTFLGIQTNYKTEARVRRFAVQHPQSLPVGWRHDQLEKIFDF